MSMAHSKGYDAGWANSPIGSNPYMVGTQAYSDWRAGWHRGNAACWQALAMDDCLSSY